jgi:hypothetical protein
MFDDSFFRSAVDSRRFGSSVLAMGLAAAGVIASVSTSLAQGTPASRATYTREQQRDMLNDYINSLEDRDRFGGNRRLTAADANPAVGVTPEMKQLRPLIRSFSNEASQLTYSLNDQINRVPALRSIYSDALTVSAEAIGLDRRAGEFGDHRQIKADFQQLESDWRSLAYGLQNVRGLNQEARDSIATLNDLDLQARKVFGVQAQINRQELALEAAGLAGDVQNLLEDIDAELGRSQQAQQYLVQGGRVRQQALNIVSLARNDLTDTPVLIEEYKRFQSLWQPLAIKIQAEDNRYLERNLRRIGLSTGKIHQLLLLPQTVEKSQLVFLTSTLKKDIDEFFSRTPLILVIHLPKANRALATADQFYGVCEHFVDEVNRGVDYNELLDSFRYIEEAERSFTDVFGALNSDRALGVLQRIDQSVATIRTTLNIPREDFNRDAASELAASIENYTAQLDYSANQWLKNDPQSFSNACRTETATLANAMAAIHQDLVRGVPVAQLRREVDDAYEHWRSAYRYLVQCKTDDRPTLGRLSGQLTPALVELKTIISQSTTEQTALRPSAR